MATATATANPGDAVDMANDLNVLNMQSLATVGVLITNNIITTHKMLDNDYIESHRMVSLQQALGAREVGSKQNPGGPSSPKINPQTGKPE